MRKLSILALILFALASGAVRAEKPVAPEFIPGTKRVTAEEAVKLLLTEHALVVIDARRREEHAKGHIEGAVSLLDATMTEESLAAHVPTKNIPILFYCNGDRCVRSTRACQKAVSWGYNNVYWLRGGWKEWTEKGFPVAR